MKPRFIFFGNMIRRFASCLRRVFPLMALLIFSTCKGNESGHNPPANTPVSVTELAPLPAHPRILVLKDGEQKIRESITRDSTWKSIHALIIRESDRLLKKPLVEYKLSGRRLLDRSREARRKIFHFAYAWRFTGDEKYFLNAEEELLNVCSFPDWNPSHFLDVAEMTMAVAIGYDWLFEKLSTENKRLIKEAILNKGLQPSMKEGNNWWLTESGNWNQVCNASMVFGALAIYEDNTSLAQSIIERSVNSVRKTMTVYGPDGIYPEGYGYWTYGTTFNVYMIDALQKAYNSDFGLSSSPGFQKTAAYLLHMVGPTERNFNYSDATENSRVNPAMFWFANHLKDASLLYSEKMLMRDADNLTGRELPAVIIWGASIPLQSLSKPQNLTFSGGGKNPVALMRNSWSRDAIYVGLKAGSPDNGHGHMDVGSFVMDALGERWAMDLGSQEYNSLESKGVDLWSRKQTSQRWEVFRYNNLAHNTLTINDAHQLVKGYAPIINTTAAKEFLSAITDIKTLYQNEVIQAKRGVSIVEGNYVVVRDELQVVRDNTKIRWSMVTAATITVTSKNTAVLTQNGKRLLVKVVEPATVTLKSWPAQPPHDYDEPNPGVYMLGFEESYNAQKPIAITVELIPQTNQVVVEKPVAPLSSWK